MYIGYIEDRRIMGYDVEEDTSCGIKLVQVPNSTLLMIANFPSKVNVKTKRIIGVSILAGGLWLSGVQPSSAIGLSVPPAPVGSEILRKQNSPIDIETMAYNIGKKSLKQKQIFCGLDQGPKTSDNVLHIVDLAYVPSHEKDIVKEYC